MKLVLEEYSRACTLRIRQLCDIERNWRRAESDRISEVTLRWVRLVLGWVTVCVKVNRLGT